MDLWVREARLFKFGSGCTSGNSKIYVMGKGFLPIGDLFARFRAEGRPVRDFDGRGRYIDVGDADVFTMSVDEQTGEYTLDHVEFVWEYDVERDDKLTVRFDTGARATVSAWHPFLVWDGERIVERRADQLRRGDAVMGPNESAVDKLSMEPIVIDYTTTYYRTKHEHSVVLDTDLAWLIGYFMGDGSLSISRQSTTNAYGTKYEYRRLRLRFHDETVETLERVQAIVGRVFGERASIQADGRGSNGKHLAYTGRKVTGFLSALFAPGPKHDKLAMPRFVWLAGRDLALSFLAGLLDSDGSVSGGRATYTTASKGFAGEVAVLASFLGLGGGVTEYGNVATATVIRKSTATDRRFDLAVHLAHPGRRGALLDDGVAHERMFCMPLSEELAVEVFGEHSPAEWLRVPIGGETFHLGRLRYDGLVNPNKLERAVDVMETVHTTTDRVARIARSLAFVTSVDACSDDPDFYDLTVANNSNYLAGEAGLVAIHNTGSNFSRIRAEGEQLSGGGKSSGLMSFLKVGDRAAGAIKSGGTTRRAAKMVILDVDHPDIEAFVDWKVREEEKVRALVAAGYSSDFNGEAYATVSGQNSNNSVRLSNEFIKAVLDDADWDLTARTDGSVMRTVKARELWSKIAHAAWACADPGVQFHTTLNEWHTSPAGGEIRASNPCSEYVFIDNTACNLASLNLGTFYDDATGQFDLDAYRHAIRLWTMVLEISVTMAHFPSAEIARGSYDYRTLGLGYANLGSLLMRMGIAYDSDEGRAITGALTAILTGWSYATSANMAAVLGPFPQYEPNAESMLRVMRNHRRAAYNAGQDEYEGVSHHVVAIDPEYAPADMLEEARLAWDDAVALGEEHGYRNAQSTCIAPTGTIGLLMDADTTGVEPDFALVKFKKLAGGGYFKIANQSIAPALRHLGYSEDKITRIVDYVVGTMSLHRAPHINTATLIAKGFTADDVDKIEQVLPGVFELGFAFNQWTLGEETMRRVGFAPERYNDPSFDMLRALGFTTEQIADANDYVCGRQTIEGAPGLLDEHLPVFDCANRNGRYGKRFIHHMGHIRIMAAAQPFISGAISKTINMPNEVTVEEIEESYRVSWELGLKAMALYRDGSKASQPLSASSDGGTADDEPEELEAEITREIQIHAGMFRPGLSPTQAYANLPRPRFLLPARRGGFTQEARVGGHKLFVRTGEYADGTLGELFIDLAKEGATLRGVLSCFAIAVSKGLQYGVPLEEFVDTFTFQTFEPRGMVEGHPHIKMANSIIDYVFRSLGVDYLHRDELAQVPPDRSGELPEPPSGIAVDAGTQLDLTDAAMEDDIAAQVSAAAFVDAAHEHDTGRVAIAASVHATGNGSAASVQTAAVQAVLADKMGDAPLCDTCGHITVRNGSCYRCLNCGDSKGCS
jgi:ribonucleoside-diphosphate reductase alpha chain